MRLSWRYRRSIVKAMSNMGTLKDRTASARPTTVPDLAEQITLAPANMNPRNILPQSPMKIRAGLKLNIRNQAIYYHIRSTVKWYLPMERASISKSPQIT